jgi:hypothetical protein
LTDVAIAIVLFAVVFFSTLAPLNRPTTLDSGAGFVLASFASLPPLLMIGGFWHVRRYLKAEAAYEDLRSGKRPSLAHIFDWLLSTSRPRVLDQGKRPSLAHIFDWLLDWLLRFPCSAVVLFALLTGIALAAWGCGDWGPAVRTSLMQVTTPLPPVATAIRSVAGEEAAPWPGWVDFVLSLVYSSVVFALVAAWFERGSQRQNYVASLFTEEDRPPRRMGSGLATHRMTCSPNHTNRYY